VPSSARMLCIQVYCWYFDGTAVKIVDLYLEWLGFNFFQNIFIYFVVKRRVFLRGFSQNVLILIYLLTAIGLTSGGSSTVHIYTQRIHRTTQNKQYTEQHKIFWSSAGRAPSLRGLPWHLP
jgi:hypothetical protein